jgi:hypothetical protein
MVCNCTVYIDCNNISLGIPNVDHYPQMDEKLQKVECGCHVYIRSIERNLCILQRTISTNFYLHCMPSNKHNKQTILFKAQTARISLSQNLKKECLLYCTI